MQSISRLSVIVFILVFNAGHRQFTCCWCPNLNLREISESESESDALRIHVLGEGCLPSWGVCLGGLHLFSRGQADTCKTVTFPQLLLRTVTTKFYTSLFLHREACFSCQSASISRITAMHQLAKGHELQRHFAIDDRLKQVLPLLNVYIGDTNTMLCNMSDWDR